MTHYWLAIALVDLPNFISILCSLMFCVSFTFCYLSFAYAYVWLPLSFFIGIINLIISWFFYMINTCFVGSNKLKYSLEIMSTFKVNFVNQRLNLKYILLYPWRRKERVTPDGDTSSKKSQRSTQNTWYLMLVITIPDLPFNGFYLLKIP